MSTLPLLSVISHISEHAYLLSGLALGDVIRFIELTSLCHPVLCLAKSIHTPSLSRVAAHTLWAMINERQYENVEIC